MRIKKGANGDMFLVRGCQGIKYHPPKDIFIIKDRQVYVGTMSVPEEYRNKRVRFKIEIEVLK